MISFYSKKEGFKVKEVLKKKKWLKKLAENEGFKISELSYIFMDDEALLKINIEYLQHDTYTDIITFDNSEKKGKIEGDIFISVDRVNENATKFKVDFETELLRVLAHGLLHLCGYKDKKKEEETLMRAKEEYYLNIWSDK
ncbi:MAG: rRNA maturation RNase YbeY [Bacteroidetes bacterium]|nr:rRNA maturation RNase YbeY [Bacteroidota bacterium]